MHKAHHPIHPSPTVQQWFDVLGLPHDYAERFQLLPVDEAAELQEAGLDVFGRAQWLEPQTLQSWLAMQAAAKQEGVALAMVSAYRSFDYQAGLLQKKMAQGLGLDEILSVSAAPGFSEHHSGRALDISVPDADHLTDAFADTLAYQWLKEKARSFGFVESFGPNNRHGLIWEPWHWCHHPLLSNA